MMIEQLGLGPYAKAAALRLRAEFGDVVDFRRGYRDLQAQAWDMSGNVIRNIEWIKQTYTRTERPSFLIAQQLQEIVYKHAHVKDRLEVSEYLHKALLEIPGSEAISFHMNTFNGQPAAEAFDITPLEDATGKLTEIGEQVVARIQTLPHLDAFKRREGGLRIWHLQFLGAAHAVQV